ncbi:MAG TPA: type II toxin-antitoxin system VapC family toxin [Terriglobia bacterium]|nr:type II toxin-antitoxin system VapC family toxin [Terriglobia bacterium]
MKNYVLDASALMAFFEDRSGAGKVEALLAEAAGAKGQLSMSVVNWGEVFYSIWRVHGEAAEAKLREIAQLPIELVAVDLDLAKLSASLKAEHRLPYADCFAAALARVRKATLVTSDKDFERATSLVKILWV